MKTTRKISRFQIDNHPDFDKKLINWAGKQTYFSFFQGNGFQPLYGSFETFLAVGAVDAIVAFKDDPFESLKQFHNKYKDWMVGRFSYDIKNYVEKLSSNNKDYLVSPEMAFFIPETLISHKNRHLVISSFNDPDQIWNDILQTSTKFKQMEMKDFVADTTQSEYIHNVNTIKNHIIEGDFYELNYCMEYLGAVENPELGSLYYHLNRISPMPFSVFQGIEGDYILSASPERFLKMADNSIIAQPIKGTIRRDPNLQIDEGLKKTLESSEKEIAENMMIMDLMRNDLSKSAIPGTLRVPELFKIYSFNHLHQMISTITASRRKNIHFTEVIKNAFPMGSMTGAPKIKAMEMIDRFENAKRGNFSGAAGYVKPNEDFDFNVLIRSFFYNKNAGFLKYNVGSAITYDAIPENEYAECKLKASALLEAISACLKN